MGNGNLFPVTPRRSRRQRQGIVRVEFQVRKEDVPLVRNVAAALVDPEREDETHTILCARIAMPRARGVKALLSAAPFEGMDLDCPREFGRDAFEFPDRHEHHLAGAQG